MGKYIFTNLLGSFVIDSSYRIIDVGTEDKLLRKYNDLKRPTKEEINSVLAAFREKVHEFYEPNIALTKQELKMSVSKDNLVIQAIKHIEELQKISNTLAKRLREWYELYNPEFSKAVENNERFTRLAFLKRKKQLLRDINIKPEESMGAELSPCDLVPIKRLAKQLNELYELEREQERYLSTAMNELCPNITAVAGVMIGAKLIEYAGSLEKLAEMPASTVQLLGAERALFRHLSTGAKCPKYGILFNHELVANSKDKGKVARALADKISIAAKVDYFKGKFVGDKLRKKLEERFRWKKK